MKFLSILTPAFFSIAYAGTPENGPFVVSDYNLVKRNNQLDHISFKLSLDGKVVADCDGNHAVDARDGYAQCFNSNGQGSTFSFSAYHAASSDGELRFINTASGKKTTGQFAAPQYPCVNNGRNTVVSLPLIYSRIRISGHELISILHRLAYRMRLSPSLSSDVVRNRMVCMWKVFFEYLGW